MKEYLINSILNSIRHLAMYDAAEVFNFDCEAVVKEETKLQVLIESYLYDHHYDFIELLQLFDKCKIPYSYHIMSLFSNETMHILTINTTDIII